MTRRFSSFEEFWPYYLEQHRHPVCRGLHLAGLLAALVCLGLGIAGSPYWLLGAPVSGYGLAWLGHLAFERNRPATFGHPFWSLRGDFRMIARMLSGRLESEKEV